MAFERPDIMTDDWIAQTRSSAAVRVPKAAELIANDLRQRIVVGVLNEGDMLPPEAELMIEFQVSRASLREALRILEAEGLIEVRRGANGGARVRVPREDTAARSMGMLLQLRGATLSNMFDARLIIEPPLMHQLALRRTDEDIAAIRKHIEYEREHLTDRRLFAAAAARFHHVMVTRAGNVALALIVGMLDELYLRHLNAFIASDHPDQSMLNQHALINHQQLLSAIEARDGPAAEVVWRYHMQSARTVILGQLGEATPLSLY